MTDEQRESMRQQRDALEAELKAALPADEQRKLEQAQEERDKQMQEFANMTDDERRSRFMNNGAMDKMMRDRLLNSTPEQRAQMGQRMGGGPGGPGGGGPGGGGRGGPGGGRP